MSSREKWTPAHWRRGCWVEPHTRANGVRVQRHWREGTNVKGHYSENAIGPLTPQRRRAVWPRRTQRVPDNATTVCVEKTLNNAAAAMALQGTGAWTVVSEAVEGGASGSLQAVLWRAGQDRGRAENGADGISIPADVDQITLQVAVRQASGKGLNYRLESSLFVNADGTVTVTPDHRESMEAVSRMIDRICPLEKGSAAGTRRRNGIRARMGRTRPEEGVALALADALEMAPLPDLPTSREVVIEDPTGRYLISARRLESREATPA